MVFPHGLWELEAPTGVATIRVLIHRLKGICFRFDEILTLLLN
jgi:hypothetical protein